MEKNFKSDTVSDSKGLIFDHTGALNYNSDYDSDNDVESIIFNSDGNIPYYSEDEFPNLQLTNMNKTFYDIHGHKVIFGPDFLFMNQLTKEQVYAVVKVFYEMFAHKTNIDKESSNYTKSPIESLDYYTNRDRIYEIFDKYYHLKTQNFLLHLCSTYDVKGKEIERFLKAVKQRLIYDQEKDHEDTNWMGFEDIKPRRGGFRSRKRSKYSRKGKKCKSKRRTKQRNRKSRR